MAVRTNLLMVPLFSVVLGSLRSEPEQERIPELLAREGRSLTASATRPSGWVGPDPMATLLKVTDVIVRGRLGALRSHLSDDERHVHTEYEILDPTYLYRAILSSPNLPPATTVTMKGGSVTINGLAYTATHEALPLPEPGMECLFLLRHYEGRYHLAGEYYGLLHISEGRLRQIADGQNFAAEYVDVPASEAIQHIVERRFNLGQ